MCAAKRDDGESETGSRGRAFVGALGGAASRGFTRTKELAAATKNAAAEGAGRASAAVEGGFKSATESATAGYERARASVTRAKEVVRVGARRATASVGDNGGAIAAFLSLPELLSWSESVTKSAATIYDKALDAQYLRDHIGGGNHRLFDHGHDLVGAWERVRSTSELDSFGDEVLGYVQALWKDATTTKGLPFVTWEKPDYDKVAEVFSSVPGVSRAWVYDLFSYDVFEVFAAGLGAVGILFALQHDDLARLSELLGSMGVTSIIAANPIMGLAVIVTTGYAYWRKGKMVNGASLAKGATLAGLSAAMFAVMGLPVLLELAIVIVATQLTRKHVLENEALRAIVASKLRQSHKGAREAFDHLVVMTRGWLPGRQLVTCDVADDRAHLM